MNGGAFWRGKRVFVTGHTGFKGAWLCKILEYLGAEVTGYALEPDAQPNLYGVCRPGVRSVIGDIRDYDALLDAYRQARPEVVFHLAAQAIVLASYRQPRYTYDVNVMGTVNLLECARQSSGAASIVNVTTDKVYFNQEREEGYREEEPLNGYDPYSNSKSCSELVTSSYRSAFFDAEKVALSSARSGNVIGGGDFAQNRIIPDCARAAAKGEAIQVRNPFSIRPYQHVCDTLFAYLLIARRQCEDTSLAGSYNIGPEQGDCATSGALTDLFCGAWGQGASWERVSVTAPHEANLLKLDCGKIARALGWSPRWDIQRSVKESVAWYKAFYSGGDPNEVMARQIVEFMEAEYDAAR